MFIWHRVFATAGHEIPPAEICAVLTSRDVEFRPTFRGDDQGWFSARFHLAGDSSIQVERYLVREERMRGELNSWCAWVEASPQTPQQAAVLDRLVACQQIFTLLGECPEGETPALVCRELAQWLAVRLEGIFQIDGQGFFDSAGNMLVAEASSQAPA
jgi:hypothetical protein